MGKKLKKKSRNVSGQKERSHSGQKLEARLSTIPSCDHMDSGVDLKKFSENIQSLSSDVRCEDCRNNGEMREKVGRSKHGKAKGVSEVNSNSKSIWVCLACGHLVCGWQNGEFKPQSHALRHWKSTHHPYVVQWDNPVRCWCFSCNSWISGNNNKEGGGIREEESDKKNEHNDSLSEVVKLIKKKSSKGSAELNVEDVWFGSCAEEENHPENVESVVSDVKKELKVIKGYLVRGLVNLGNTCFFNSVMQNLFALDMMRRYFMNLNQSVGPLTLSLKKLFNETSTEEEYKNLKNDINPKSFFGCICSKAPQFRGYQQQDSHELLRCLLDGLHVEELVSRKSMISSKEVGESEALNPGATFVDVFFGGKLSSTVCCVECGHSSVVYEPFLDLSLPVPTKKIPVRKAPVARSKRASGPTVEKPSWKEGNKGRKYRGKGNTNTNIAPVVIQCTAKMTNNMQSDTSESSSSVVVFNTPAKEERVALEEDFSWMDYINSATISDDTSCNVNFDASEKMHGVEECSSTFVGKADSPDGCRSGEACLTENHDSNLVSWDDDISIMLNPDMGPALQNHDILPCSEEPQIAAMEPLLLRESRSDAPKLGSESSGENCHRDEFPPMVKDNEILLLPYKEDVVTVAETMEVMGSPQNSGYGRFDSIPRTSSTVGCEQTEEDFNGFGDLFNEPEIGLGGLFNEHETVQASEEVGLLSETETALLAGNSSESNQDEVDNADGQVSINSCLAYFTKPELLSGEHAWICESCSKILDPQRKSEIKDSEEHGVTLDNRSITSEDKDNVDTLGLEKGFTRSTESKILENGKLTKNVGLTEDAENLLADGGSLNGTNSNGTQELSFGQIGNERDLEISNPPLNGQANYPEVPCRDTNLGELNAGSQENSYSSDLHRSSLEVSSSSSQARDPNRNNDFCNKVDQGKQKRSRSLGRLNKLDNRKTTKLECENGKKVKRDATKRILINKAPLILTIHLKRFSQDARGRLSKLSGHVSFVDMLDLRPYMDPRSGEKDKCWYRLVGVVEHSGTMKGGHYIAYVRGERSRGKSEKESDSCCWFYASDSYVREVSLMEVLQSEAYILFYEKM